MTSQLPNRILSTSLRMRNLISASASRHVRLFSGLPYHLVVGMPALSPTMETGTISAWKLKEGDSFAAGDSLAEIETDKATIDFEAQDDGVIAKILVEAGTADVAVGVPVLVTVEEEEDVEAFRDYVVETKEDVPVIEEKEESAPEPIFAANPEPAVVVPPAPTVVISSAPTPDTESFVAPATEVPAVGSNWGNFARVKSPLASLLSADQKKYVEEYGSTGQLPL